MARFRLMELEEKAIYVALGIDREEGLKTLRWALEKWKFHPISIIILHIDFTKDTVKTYYGTMPASSINEEMVEFLRRKEQEKFDTLLSQYKLFCGKVKVKILKVEKYDKILREHIIDLISGLNVTNLVMGLSFMKSSSRISRSAISGCFYIHQHKPEFCDLFIISGGKQILIIDSDQEQLSPSSPNLDLSSFKHQWESYGEEIENYLQHLLSQNLDEEDCDQESSNNNSNNNGNSPMEAEMKELQNSNMSSAEKSECLKTKIKELNDTIRSKINEWKLNSDRLVKAEWTISFCNRRAIEMETLTIKEAENRAKLKEELDTTRELLGETLNDLEEKKTGLKSSIDLQSKLFEKLQGLSTLRSQVEEELGEATIERTNMIEEIERFRKQTNVIRRKIEFCNNNNNNNFEETKCELREFSNEEMRLATEDFSERVMIKSVYKGRLNLQTVAIKIINDVTMSQEDFRIKVKFLSNIRHPHLVSIIGFCCEPKCIVFEYMHNGTLRDILFPSSRSSAQTNPALTWHSRVHIAAQLCSGLCYLHLARPKPITHGQLTASDVLLDRNLVAKISGLGLGPCHDRAQIGSDVKAFGLLLLQLLAGSNWAGLVDEAMLVDKAGLAGVLDETGGEWPLDMVEGLALLAFKCLNTNVNVEMVMEEVDVLRKKADGLFSRRRQGGDESQGHQFGETPSAFLCPIFQDVMENPHVAADGFSYELEAIKEWFKMGRDTSPMTNLKLKHKILTPNHTLNYLIQHWNNKRSIVPP